MQELKKGKSPLVTLEKGKSVQIGLNRLVDFRIVTVDGTVIEGKIPANEYLKVTSGGDIASFDIDVHDLQRDLKVAD